MVDRKVEYKDWVLQYSDLLYNFTLKKGFDESTAKDIVQDTFLAAWKNVDSFKGEASPKNWLFTILKNKIADYFRKSANKIALQTVHSGHNDHTFFDEEDHWKKGMYPKAWQVNFSNDLEVKEFYKVFSGCGKKLKQVQHTVFIMKYVDGLESDDICKELSITPSNYWILIHRAKVQLRACLEKHWL